MNARAIKKYKIQNKHRFAELLHFALQYNYLKMRIHDEILQSAEQDGMPHGSQVGNPTAQAAIRIDELSSKIHAIEKAAKLCAADEGLQKAVLYAATHENVSFERLKARGLVQYERDAFYIARRRFYYELDKMV